MLDQTKLKAFADDKLNETKMIISVFDRVENIMGKGEIACISNFSFSHNVFKRLLSQTHQKVSLCWNGLKLMLSNSLHWFLLTLPTLLMNIFIFSGLLCYVVRDLTRKKQVQVFYSQFSLHLYNEIAYMCNDKTLVQR